MTSSVLKKSLALTWRHPSLWFWGFLSTLLFLSANDLLLLSVSPTIFSSLYSAEGKILTNQVFSGQSFLIVLGALLLILGIIILAVFSEIKLILSVRNTLEENAQPAKKKKIRTILLLRFFEFVLSLVLWLPSVFWLKEVGLPWSLFFLFFVLILNLIFLFVVRYAILFILLKNQPLFYSLRLALFFLKTNWLKTLKLSFALFLIIFVYGLVFLSFLRGGALVYPLRWINMALTNFGGNYGFWTSLVLTIVIGGFIQIIILGFIAAYQITSWVVFFLEDACEQPVAYS